MSCETKENLLRRKNSCSKCGGQLSLWTAFGEYAFKCDNCGTFESENTHTNNKGSNMPLVYLAGAIKGLSYDGATSWRNVVELTLSEYGIKTTSPMRTKKHLEKEVKLNAAYDNHVLSTPRAIITRDYFDCMRADALIVNLWSEDTVSIGTVMEIAWAYSKRTPIIAITGLNGTTPTYAHPMINEAIDYKVSTIEEACYIAVSILGPYA